MQISGEGSVSRPPSIRARGRRFIHAASEGVKSVCCPHPHPPTPPPPCVTGRTARRVGRGRRGGERGGRGETTAIKRARADTLICAMTSKRAERGSSGAPGHYLQEMDYAQIRLASGSVPPPFHRATTNTLTGASPAGAKNGDVRGKPQLDTCDLCLSNTLSGRIRPLESVNDDNGQRVTNYLNPLYG